MQSGFLMISRTYSYTKSSFILMSKKASLSFRVVKCQMSRICFKMIQGLEEVDGGVDGIRLAQMITGLFWITQGARL